MTVIVKTKMTEIPNSCSECKLSAKCYGTIMCPILKDWIEPFEIEEGKKKLKGCPLEQI